MPTATSHPSSWRSVRLSASGPTLSGTSSSPCKVSEEEKQAGGGRERGSHLLRPSLCPLLTEDRGFHLSQHLSEHPLHTSVNYRTVCPLSALLSQHWAAHKPD